MRRRCCHVGRALAWRERVARPWKALLAYGAMTSPATVHRHHLHPNVRRSPYFEQTERAGAVEYMVYNHMYMPVAYDRPPEEDYAALVKRVTLWDVGAE